MSTLGAQLQRHAREAPGQRAVFAGERWWTYGELVEAAERVRRELALRPGDVAAILVGRGIEPVIAICAAALASAVPATIDPSDRALASETLAKLRPAVVLGALDASCDVLACDGAAAHLTRRTAPLAWEPVPRADGIAHIIFTSGTTSESKGVVWSESRAGFDWAVRPPPPLHRAAPGAISVPLSAAFGLQDLLRSLYHRLATVLLDSPFPVGIAQARALAVNRIKLTPTHVAMLLASAEELPAVRAVVIGAAAIEPAQVESLAARLPDARIGRSYGLTEIGAGTAVWHDRHPGKMHTVGRAIAMRAVSIRDRKGNVLPPRTWGEVVIEVPVWDRGDGYLEAPPELDRRFRNARLWTGDRGMLDARGFLVLGPRAAEIIKVGGRSASAPRIEHTLSKLGAVEDLAVVGVADRMLGEAPCVVYVPGAGDPVALARAARTAVREDELPRWFLPRYALPRTANGKVRRGVLAREAAGWTQTFTDSAVWGHRVYPAFVLQGDVAVVDGGVDPAFHDREAIEADARVVLLMQPGAARILAVGCVRCARVAGSGTARFVLGPIVVARRPGQIAPGLLDVFAGELIRLARLLPGAEPAVEYAFASRARPFSTAGFAAVPDPPGWYVRRAGEGAPDVIQGLPGDAARGPARFEAWAQRLRATLATTRQ